MIRSLTSPFKTALWVLVPSTTLAIASCRSSDSDSPSDTGGAGGQGDAGASAASGPTAGSTGEGGTASSAPVPEATLPVTISGEEALPVSPFYFGQNYWSWVKAWGNPVAGTANAVNDMNLGLLRAGGFNNESGEPEPFTLAEIDAFVAFAQAAGTAPLLQVSVINNQDGEPATAADAAALVEYVNQTQDYGVRFFSIGNEPDLYTEQDLKPAGYTAADACETFAEYAEAMRAVDPDIEIMGPDLSWKYVPGNDWLTPFLTDCGEHVDIVAVHRYPFAPTATTVAAAYADAAAFRQSIRSVRAIMAATGQSDKPLAYTEANITYDGEPAKSILPASPGTFPAALWVADSIGVGLEEALHSLSYWSLSEGWTLGFFDGATPRPAAHVLKLFATRFGSEVLTVSGGDAEVSVYAGRDADAGHSTLFIVNKTAQVYEIDVTLSGLPRTDQPKVIAPASSLVVATLPDDGGAVQVTTFQEGMTEPL